MTGVIIGMAIASVASGITGKILEGLGKTTEAMYIDFFAKAGIAGTAVTAFITFVNKLRTLG